MSTSQSKSTSRKVVIAGGKYDVPAVARLKLHEEYGRVWLYMCDEDGRSLQKGRLLCIDDDGVVRIHAPHALDACGNIRLEWPDGY